MKKVLFVCHGNICRSPMAEFVMKDLVEKAGLSAQFEIASAATSTEEIGNPVYPPARRKLAEHGISCAGKTARQMTRRDYETYDYLIAMDHNNLRNMARFVWGDPEHKVSLLMDHTRRPGDVADPWYTGDFEATWQDVLEAAPPCWKNCDKKGKAMTERYCEGERFTGLSFAGEAFESCDFADCVFVDCSFSKCELDHTTLNECRFVRCEITGLRSVSSSVQSLDFDDCACRRSSGHRCCQTAHSQTLSTP